VKVNIVILVHLLVLYVKLVNFWQIMQCHISDHGNVQFSFIDACSFNHIIVLQSINLHFGVCLCIYLAC